MVLPPTGLTTILYAAEPTVEGYYTALRRAGCLTWRARWRPDGLRALLATALDGGLARPSHPGPSLQDGIAGALLNSPFLNSRGRRLGRGPA